jgi:hypothetical protein
MFSWTVIACVIQQPYKLIAEVEEKEKPGYQRQGNIYLEGLTLTPTCERDQKL